MVWGVEVVFVESSTKSVFHSARRLILDKDCVQVQLPDGSYVAYSVEEVRKVLSMRGRIEAEEDTSSDSDFANDGL